MDWRKLIVIGLVLVVSLVSPERWAKKKKNPKKKDENITKIISAKDFIDAINKLAKDERVPVASSTLVEKGRGEEYYSVGKMLDKDPETFWAEGAKGWGQNEWVAFYFPEGTTHVEITPGAGNEQFENFNRPKLLFLDMYHVRLKRDEQGDYKPKFKWLGRTEIAFKDKSRTVRKELAVKLPELVISGRSMYIGVLIIKKVYKGQFDDTSISEFKTHIIWGEN